MDLYYYDHFMHPFVSWSMHCSFLCIHFIMEHSFISQSMIVLLYVHLSHGMSIVFLVCPLISWSIFLCIHLYLIMHLFPFYLFYTLLHSYASIYLIFIHPFYTVSCGRYWLYNNICHSNNLK